MNKEQNFREFDSLLNECLDAVLAGETTIEGCLERYPQYADLLRPELQAAVLVSRLKSPQMAEGSVRDLEARLRTRMQTPRPRNVIHIAGLTFSRAAAAVMIAFLLIFGSGAGVVAASANTIPGDTLYPVKRLWELLILLLAPLTGELDDLWLHLARTRFGEVQSLIAQGRLSEDALFDLYEATAKTIELSDAQTARQALAYMHNAQAYLQQTDLPLQYEILYRALISLMAPIQTSDGRLMLPPGLQADLEAASTPPTPDETEPASAATSTENMPSATSSAAPTSSPTPQPTMTFTATIADTPTPRIPATATRTPTLSPTPTLTETPLPTATFTWTPLPLPPSRTPFGAPSSTPAPATLPSGPTATETPLTPGDSPFIRQTQQSVYMTQTAQAQDTSP